MGQQALKSLKRTNFMGQVVIHPHYDKKNHPLSSSYLKLRQEKPNEWKKC
jgi:hypothetical protein